MKISIDYETLRGFVQRHIEEHGLRKTARMMGFSPTYISQVKSNQALPSDKIAKYFGYEKQIRFVRDEAI